MRRRIAAVLVFALAGCGYHFAGAASRLPPDVRALSVGTITNRSRDYGLEKMLAFALEREIHLRRHFRVEEDPGAGDAVLSGTIREVTVRPVAFDASDQAVQYELALNLDLVLRRQHDGRVLWQVSGLREVDEYGASARVLVTSSSQFQRETLEAADVGNPQFSRIQLTETERRHAIGRLLRRAARSVYDQMIEDF